MKREFLKSLGLSDEAIDKAMAEHGNSVNGLKSKVAELEEQINTYKQQVSDRDKQLDSLKKSAGDSEKLQAQISKLQEENKLSSEAYEAKIAQMGIENAVNLALTNAKAKNVKAVRALLNLDGAKMDGDKIIGLEEQIAKLKESDAYMFEVESKPKISGTVPATGGTPAPAAKPGSYEYFAQMHSGGSN